MVAIHLLATCVRATVIVALLFQTVMLSSAECVSYPLRSRIGNVTLPNHQVARGIEMFVGEPAQPFAFLPQWPSNTSFVYGTSGYCLSDYEPWSETGCTTFRGGAYDSLASKSRTQPDPGSFPVEGPGSPDLTQVADTLRLSDNNNLTEVPLGVVLHDWHALAYHPMAALGLGANSTLLNTLRASGKIASKSWGFFWGRNGGSPASQLDGNFVIGGYDRAKVSGQAFVHDMQPSSAVCSSRMMVAITDLILSFPDGTTASLFPPEGAPDSVQACIVPDYPVLMTIPQDPYIDNFMSATNMFPSQHLRSLGVNYQAIRYFLGEPRFGGDLTIELQSGLSVRIPNDQLIVPSTSIDLSTGASIANYTVPEIVINALHGPTATDLPQLGRQFLTAAYLMANEDVGKFTLWSANPTLHEDIVAVRPDNVETTEFCHEDDTDTSGAGETPSKPLESPSATLAPGAIAGASVGGVLGLVLVGLFAWWIVRRKTTRASSGVMGRDEAMEPYAESRAQGVPGPKSEFSGYSPSTAGPTAQSVDPDAHRFELSG